jgi:hypothetical protein
MRCLWRERLEGGMELFGGWISNVLTGWRIDATCHARNLAPCHCSTSVTFLINRISHTLHLLSFLTHIVSHG